MSEISLLASVNEYSFGLVIFSTLRAIYSNEMRGNAKYISGLTMEYIEGTKTEKN